MSYALEGLRIVELGTHVAVPSACRLMADFGAEVVKIEGIKGDPYRTFAQSDGLPTEPDFNTMFTNFNTGKKLISLDLKSEEGKEVLFRLLENADAFVTNVRASGLKHMGIDYESIKDRFPKLVYYHFTGLGLKGPDAARPGFDIAAFWARSGGLSDGAFAGGYPAKPSKAMGDVCSGSMIAFGLLAAITGARQTGRGTFLTSSLYSSGMWYMVNGILSAQKRFAMQYPLDPERPADPSRHFYKCADGEWIVLWAQNYEGRWDSLCELFGMQDLHDDPECNTLKAAQKSGKTQLVFTRIRDAFLNADSAEWCRRLLEADLVHERMRHFKDVTVDEQAWANDYLSEVAFAGGREKIILPNTPVQMSAFEKKAPRSMGECGLDTKEVLASLGYSADEIAAMQQKGAVKAL